MTPRRFLAAAVLALATAAASSVFAEAPSADQQSAERRPGQIARDHVDEVLRNLEKFVAGLPRYGLPEVRENGDIVIPRRDMPESRPSREPGTADVTDI